MHEQERRRKAYLLIYMDWSIAMEKDQAQPRAHQSEAVASGASQGAVAPWVCPHPQRCLSSPPCLGGAINAGASQFWWFPYFAAQTIMNLV
jgi:hypothetical protein